MSWTPAHYLTKWWDEYHNKVYERNMEVLSKLTDEERELL